MTDSPQLQALRDDLDQISAAASHDLADPLREALQLCAQIEQPAQSLALQSMQQKIKTSLARIQILRDYAHLSTSNEPLKPVDLNLLLDEIREQHAEPLRQNGATLVYTALPVIQARRSQLVHLLVHLIKNGVQFNDSTAPIITISAEEQPDHWLLCVRDNGEGIEPEFRHLVFGLFRRIDPHGAGHGAGLAFCKRITELHGGTIALESEKDAFTRISIRWPKHQSA